MTTTEARELIAAFAWIEVKLSRRVSKTAELKERRLIAKLLQGLTGQKPTDTEIKDVIKFLE